MYFIVIVNRNVYLYVIQGYLTSPDHRFLTTASAVVDSSHPRLFTNRNKTLAPYLSNNPICMREWRGSVMQVNNVMLSDTITL